MKKKVCMVVPSFIAKGGITTLVNGYKGSMLEDNYEIHYIETFCDGNKTKKILKAITAYLLFLREFIFWHPDVIHIHSSFGASFNRKYPFILISSIFKTPIINHIHGSAIEDFFYNAKENRRNKIIEVYSKCKCLIALSDQWKKTFSKAFNIENIHVVENYSVCHNDSFKEKIRKKEIYTILFLGFITESKGCFDFPDIVEKVVNKVKNVKFIIAGNGQISKIKSDLHEKGISKFVNFPGWIKNGEKEEILRNADIFFLPSHNEGMPMSILEAMGYGLPIVSTNVGGIPNLVHENVNGYLLAPRDIDGFANALIKLIKDNELLNQMGKESFKIANEGYSIERHLKKIEKIYANVLREKATNDLK